MSHYPNAHCYIDPFELCRAVSGLSMEEVGAIVLDFTRKGVQGDEEGLKQYRFIKKYRRGRLPGTRKYIPESIRSEVLAVGRCAYCGSSKRLTVDHKKPVALGGTDDRKNLQCLCKTCNSRKGARWED